VDIPVVLSIAATTKIREHPQFGDMLFQLANNVDVYSNQLLRYFWQYAEPRPSKLWIFYQDDEYGRSGRAALVGQAAQYGLDVRSRSIQNDLAAGDSYAADQLKAAQALGDAAREADERTLIILVALGRSLRLMVDQIKPKQLQSKVATFTSIDLVALDAGTFDGIYVAYSYFPRTYSVGTLAFLEHTRQATVRAEELLGETSNPDWGDIGTVEAEAHDAAYYWVSTRLIRRLGISCPREGVREYATMFSIIGSGKAQYMNTALLLFQVRGGLMIPVELKK
jgi:ABC-type branched-subunit amino acid transport system substrate-binding protein